VRERREGSFAPANVAPLSLIFWYRWMLPSQPGSTDHGTNCLPARCKVCNLENSRIKLDNLFQADEYSISHRSIGNADKLPAMIICIVRDQ